MATRTIANGGGNWSATGTWVEGIVPVDGDDVVATGTSGQLTVDTASAATSLDFTNYTNTLTLNATATIHGGVKFVAAMSIAGTSTLIVTGVGTGFVGASKTLLGGLTFGHPASGVAYTVSGNITVNGLLSICQVGGGSSSLDGGTITAAGGLSINASNPAGTTVITLTGGTWSGVGASGMRTALTFAGNSTISGTVHFGSKTLTYSSGTITVAGSTVVLDNVTGTVLNLGTLHLNNLTTITANTVTLSSAVIVDGVFDTSAAAIVFSGAFGITCGSWVGGSATFSGAVTCSGTATLAGGTYAGGFAITAAAMTLAAQTHTFNSPFTISGLTTCSGAVTWNGSQSVTTGGLSLSASNVSGTGAIVFGGTGTWSSAGGSLANNVTINTAGTLTLSGTILYLTGTITYTAGTISAGASVLSMASGTLTTSSMTWANVTLTGTTLTLGSALVVSGILTLPNSAMTFSGAFNITVGTLTNVDYTATRIVTFVSGTTITINTAFTSVHTGASTIRFTWKTSSGGTTAAWKLVGGATQSVLYVDPTDLDASSGQTIFTVGGVITNSLNWTSSLPPLATEISSIYMS